MSTLIKILKDAKSTFVEIIPEKMQNYYKYLYNLDELIIHLNDKDISDEDAISKFNSITQSFYIEDMSMIMESAEKYLKSIGYERINSKESKYFKNLYCEGPGEDEYNEDDYVITTILAPAYKLNMYGEEYILKGECVYTRK